MIKIDFYILVAGDGSERIPFLRDILNAVSQAGTRYPSLESALVAQGNTRVDYAEVFGVDMNGKIYLYERGVFFLRYIKVTPSLYPTLPAEFCNACWISRWRSHIAFYDASGCRLGDLNRLMFRPNRSFEIPGQFNDIMLSPTKLYPMLDFSCSDGACYNVGGDDSIAYENLEYWQKNGSVIELWNNDDAEFRGIALLRLKS